MKTKDLGNKKIMSENIKRHLNSKGLNVKDFSEAMNFKYTTVLDWVNAKTYPRIDKIELMARYFGVDKSDLVEEYSETNSTIAEINRISSQLDESRQQVVLATANVQLKEQNDSKAKVIPMKKKSNVLTDEALQEAVDTAVAFDGIPLNEQEKEAAKALIRRFWEEDHPED